MVIEVNRQLCFSSQSQIMFKASVAARCSGHLPTTHRWLPRAVRASIHLVNMAQWEGHSETGLHGQTGKETVGHMSCFSTLDHGTYCSCVIIGKGYFNRK